ncbi:MAG: hypothetical protein WCJ68_05235, partial [Chitinophagia bacterium]
RLKISDTANMLTTRLKVSDTANMLASRFARDTILLSNRISLKVNISDTASMLTTRLKVSDTATMLSGRLKISDTANMLTTRLKVSDTANMLSSRFGRDTASLSNRINLKLDRTNPTITGLVIADSIKVKRYIQYTTDSILSATTTTIDMSLGNVFHIYLANSITTLTLSNLSVGTYLIKFRQIASGTGKTVAFPVAWLWAGGGSGPTITATNGRTDIVTLICDGSKIYATAVQNFY